MALGTSDRSGWVQASSAPARLADEEAHAVTSRGEGNGIRLWWFLGWRTTVVGVLAGAVLGGIIGIIAAAACVSLGLSNAVSARIGAIVGGLVGSVTGVRVALLVLRTALTSL